MSDVCSIYVITNTINDKVYVGQTWRPISERFTEHKKPNCKGCLKIHNAFNKYGRENFKIELLCSTDTQSTANYLETFWINSFDSIQSGYNLASGGSRGKPSEETKKKLSLSKMGNTHNLGHKHTKESRQLMSKAMSTNPSMSMLVKHHSDKSKEKTSCSMKGKNTWTKGMSWKLVDGKRVYYHK